VKWEKKENPHLKIGWQKDLPQRGTSPNMMGNTKTRGKPIWMGQEGNSPAFLMKEPSQIPPSLVNSCKVVFPI